MKSAQASHATQAVLIHRARLSLLWGTPFTTLLADEPVPGAPLAFCARRAEYAQTFEALVRHPASPLPPPQGAGPKLELPWTPLGKHRFWLNYLGVVRHQDARGSSAWRRLVPLRRHEAPAKSVRVELPAKLTEGVDARVDEVRSEAWFHPHLVSFALHFTLTGRMPPEVLARVCGAVRRDRVLRVDEVAADLVRVDDIAEDRLAALHREAVGPSDESAPPANDPITLLTVLEGEGAAPEVPIAEGGNIHRVLEAVTQWSPTWEDNRLPSLAENRVPARTSPDGHILYGRKRGRAVWEPKMFQPSDSTRTALSCYHRNLLSGSLQVEALLAFTSLAVAGPAFSRVEESCASAVMQALRTLHRGERPMYRSDSLRVLIDQHPLRPSVDAVAKALLVDSLPPLAGA